MGLQKSNSLIINNLFGKKNSLDSSSFNYNDFDELISDRGITYNRKTANFDKGDNFSESKDKFNEDLFEQFKQFILFQKMNQDK